MQTEHAVWQWASEEFGHAPLGDRRRTARAMAATVAAHPSGHLTHAFTAGDEREAAFRFVRNEEILPQALLDAAHTCTAQRCAEHPWVFVAVDQTDLSIVDKKTGECDDGVCAVVSARPRWRQLAGVSVCAGAAWASDGASELESPSVAREERAAALSVGPSGGADPARHARRVDSARARSSGAASRVVDTRGSRRTCCTATPSAGASRNFTRPGIRAPAKSSGRSCAAKTTSYAGPCCYPPWPCESNDWRCCRERSPTCPRRKNSTRERSTPP